MNRILVITLFVGALTTCEGAVAQGCTQPKELRGTDTPYSLWGRCLQFVQLHKGAQLPLGSIVYFPAKDSTGKLTLSLDKAELTPEFVRDLFEQTDETILNSHHLVQRGIGLFLTPTRLKLAVLPSVVVALRTDIPGDPNYRSFSGRPTFVVEEIEGRAFASKDLGRISTSFDEVFTQYLMHAASVSTKRLSDGSTVGSAELRDSLPPLRLPTKGLD